MEIACQDVIRAVSEYLDGGLPAELRTRMRLHFGRCRHCTAVLDGTRNVVTLIGDNRTFELPAGFAERVFQKMKAE